MNVIVCSRPFSVHTGGTELTKMKNSRKKNKDNSTRIIVERVYLGGQSMEDAFRRINEETVRENFKEMMKKAI